MGSGEAATFALSMPSSTVSRACMMRRYLDTLVIITVPFCFARCQAIRPRCVGETALHGANANGVVRASLCAPTSFWMNMSSASLLSSAFLASLSYVVQMLAAIAAIKRAARSVSPANETSDPSEFKRLRQGKNHAGNG